MTHSNSHYSLNDLVYLMQRLRAPEDGCAWDIQQTYRTITSSTLEEAYEVVDAIEQGDFAQLREELGDLLFQVIFYSQLASEDGRFSFADIVSGLTAKLVRRHPHVFPDGTLNSHRDSTLSADDIKQRWENLKQEERAQKGLTGILSDVPIGLPAIPRAQKLQKRAAAVGFDFANAADVLNKLQEEIAELQHAITQGQANAIEDEMGDVFFTLANLCRHLHLDGEKSLRHANQKFTARFQFIEQTLLAQGLQWSSQSPEALDQLWGLAKNSPTDPV